MRYEHVLLFTKVKDDKMTIQRSKYLRKYSLNHLRIIKVKFDSFFDSYVGTITNKFVQKLSIEIKID